jgi:CheY-like chemotaxis protein
MNELQVLLAEDNRADVLLVGEALAAHGIVYQLRLVRDGEEALKLLARIGKPGEPACPDVFLLDLNLPKVDGVDVLQAFRNHPQCGETPVIVLSSSDAPRDRDQVNALNVARYFKKPISFEGFMQLGAIVKEVVRC